MLATVSPIAQIFLCPQPVPAKRHPNQLPARAIASPPALTIRLTDQISASIQQHPTELLKVWVRSATVHCEIFRLKT
jgi:hypothetical protein